MIIIYSTCGVQNESTQEKSLECKSCEDERQYVPIAGQSGTLDDYLLLNRLYTNKEEIKKSNLFSFKDSIYFMRTYLNLFNWGKINPTLLKEIEFSLAIEKI
ncbi:hypothetical protein CJ195_12030 [Bacillus sp. UMB0899]|nr:hypothetical protein CJ195_12030 [Bacillus sp. UMB0899]